ncbi:SprT-like domain-containing protein [Capnocytophaga canis]|uniref:SprT-like domain-containing protein n=1 Tax=Capnocytophaga canis TaxID=1848903 RepID=UPI0037D7D0E7
MRRKILISSSLIYGAFLMLSGCQQEEMEQEPLQEIHKNEVHFHSEDKHVHTYDLNKLAKHNGSVFEFISKKGSKSIFSKGNNSGVYLDEEQIMKIKNGKYTSYSFLTHRENLPKNVVENLVVEQVNDTLRAYLIRYQYSDRYIDNLAKGVKNQRFDGTIIRTGYHTDLDALLKMEEPSSVHENLTRMTFNRVCYDINLIISYSCNSGKHFVGDDRCALSGSARAHNEYRTVTKCYNEIDYGWTPPMEQIDHIADDYLGGGGGTPPSAPAVVVNIKRERADGGATEIEDEIIDNLTNPCAKRILNQMRSDTGRINIANLMTPEIKRQHNFSQMIIDLFEKSSQTHLTFTNGTTKNGANGSTKGTTITLNNNYLQTATQLAIARTIIHEMVHAYLEFMYKKPLENGFTFKEAMEKYAKDRGMDVESENFHHEFMGQYVEAMAVSLQQWDIQYGTRRDLGFEYYKALSFGGLFQVDVNGKIVTETDSFKELIPELQDRQDIADKILNEQNNTRNAKGTKCK